MGGTWHSEWERALLYRAVSSASTQHQIPPSSVLHSRRIRIKSSATHQPSFPRKPLTWQCHKSIYADGVDRQRTVPFVDRSVSENRELTFQMKRLLALSLKNRWLRILSFESQGGLLLPVLKAGSGCLGLSAPASRSGYSSGGSEKDPQISDVSRELFWTPGAPDWRLNSRLWF